MKWIRIAGQYVRLSMPLKWWFSALTTCLGVFAGLLGSIYGDKIKTAFPFALVNGPIEWSVVMFWVSLLIFGWFFGLGFNAQNQATNKLEQVIRTLPPKGFLVVFEDLFKTCLNVYWQAKETQAGSNKAMESTIVTALQGVLCLVKTFDSRPDHPVYSANIMLFRPIREVEPTNLAENIIFTEPGYNPDAWDGILQLRKEFAFTMTDKDLTPDQTIKPIMLPVPKPQFRSDKGKPTVLPGAPAVYCDPTRFVGFENTLQLATWCREQSGLRASIAENVERYFVDGDGKDIRSFISIPIVLPPGPSGQNPEVLGVINLHSNREGILPGEKAGLFVPLTSPFMQLIAHCLEKYSVPPIDQKSA